MSNVNFLEKLLDGTEVEWKPLGEVAKIQRGKRLVRSQLTAVGDHAVYQNSMIPLGYYTESNVRANTTFVICAGAAGEVAYSPVDFWAADDVHFFDTPECIQNKFLYYYLLLISRKRAKLPSEKCTHPIRAFWF